MSYQPTYNIDLVLGYELVPHVLPFVEAGVSFSNVHYSVDRTDTIVDVANNTVSNQFRSLNLNDYKTGYNVGLGGSYQPHPNWILTSEVVYNDMGKNSGSNSITFDNDRGTNTHVRTIQTQSVSVFGTVSYLFG